MHTSRSKKGMLAFKADLEKAYDRLDWKFLELKLKEFNFPTPTVSLIMNCMKATNLSCGMVQEQTSSSLQGVFDKVIHYLQIKLKW